MFRDLPSRARIHERVANEMAGREATDVDAGDSATGEEVRLKVASRRWPLRVNWAGPRIALALMVVCSISACDLITAPLPPNAMRFAPPAVYARWWAMTEECSGRSGDLGAVDWYRVPGSQFIHGGQPVGGYWTSYSNRIVLAEEGIEEGDIVRHEMLHALLRVGGHPRSQFLGSCASLVDCQGSCVTDAGTWHPPQADYLVLPPESLDIAIRPELLAREADGQRWFDLEITVRNPRGRALRLAPPGDPPTPHTFGYELRGPVESWSPFRGAGIAGGEVMSDSSTVFFQPFETKKFLFEFLVADTLNESHISPGVYIVRGDYARHQTAYDTVAVSP